MQKGDRNGQLAGETVRCRNQNVFSPLKMRVISEHSEAEQRDLDLLSPSSSLLQNSEALRANWGNINCIYNNLSMRVWCQILPSKKNIDIMAAGKSSGRLLTFWEPFPPPLQRINLLTTSVLRCT